MLRSKYLQVSKLVEEIEDKVIEVVGSDWLSWVAQVVAIVVVSIAVVV